MLPLIGSFFVSLAGTLLGKAISGAMDSRKAEAARATAGDAGQPFATVLAQESQRLAQAPGATATDAPTAVGLPPVAAHFGGERALDGIQAP